MRKEHTTLREAISAAIEAGDIDSLEDLLQKERATISYGMCHDRDTPRFWATALNAVKRDPKQLQQDILGRILALQFTLLNRTENSIQKDIKDSDGRGHEHELPDRVANELLPRYGKITHEIFATMKMLNKIGKPSTKHSTNLKADA